MSAVDYSHQLVGLLMPLLHQPDQVSEPPIPSPSLVSHLHTRAAVTLLALLCAHSCVAVQQYNCISHKVAKGDASCIWCSLMHAGSLTIFKVF